VNAVIGQKLIVLDAGDQPRAEVEYLGMTAEGLVAVRFESKEVSTMPKHWLKLPEGNI